MGFKRFTLTTGSLLVLAVLLIALLILSNNLLRGMRIDLTANKLYTLSEGTENILRSIDEPINLYFFYSEQSSRDIPVLRTYATRVQELLEEFVLISAGKLRLHVIDPQPFSEEEDRANQYGLQALPVGTTGDSIYLGLAATNSVDGLETIPFFQLDKETFLEYDLSKLVYSLSQPQKPVIGLLSTLPVAGGFDPMTRQPQQPWVINDQISQLFDVRPLQPTVNTIGEDIDVLLLIHPKNLSEQTLFAIDQFILRGGRAMIFLDPHAEIDIPPQNPQNPGAAMFAERSSNLDKLLNSWGVTVDSDQVLRDGRYALTVNANPGQPPVRHLGILQLDQESFSADDVITAGLSSITMSMTGFITLNEGAKVKLTPLLTSSNLAQPMAAELARFLRDPNELQKDFSPTGQEYILAARLSGDVVTAFPDGSPPVAEGETAAPEAKFLSQSTQPINVILVADVDLLSDRLWVRVQNFFGQRLSTAWANNGDFVINSLDNLVGNSDLISMRGRATSHRPFTTVQALEQQANARFQVKEQELQAQLQETERKLAELQNARQDQGQGQGAQTGILILSPEQQAELENFQQAKLDIRKDLRQVRRELDKDIEQLGNWMKFINIGLVPLVIIIFGLLTLISVRSWRRRTR